MQGLSPDQLAAINKHLASLHCAITPSRSSPGFTLHSNFDAPATITISHGKLAIRTTGSSSLTVDQAYAQADRLTACAEVLNAISTIAPEIVKAL